MLYQNRECPVCKKKFEEGDDIVTCPECGTPHHRECYKKTGHCINEELHASGYSYNRNVQQSTPENNTSQNIEHYYIPSEAQNENKLKTVVCPNCKNEVSADSPFCSVCGAHLPSSQPTFQPMPPFSFPHAQEIFPEGEIDGEKASDAACVVGVNARRFIPLFLKKAKSNRKIGWNWSAFIFGEYYFFFRKMFKEGAITMFAKLIADIFVSAFFGEQLSAFYELAYSVTSSTDPQSIFQSKAFTDILPVMGIILAITVVKNFFCALFADNCYKNKVIGIIKNVDEKLAQGADITFSIMVDSVPPKGELRKMYLAKLGGTSFFAPVTAYFVLELVQTIISSIV